MLLATDGTWGDVGPLLAIACELHARGHTVRALLNPTFAGEARRLGLDAEEVGAPWEERLVGADHERLMRPFSGTLNVLRDYILPEVRPWALATERAARDLRPDAALVHHLCWGPLAVLQREGVPQAAAYLAPAVLLSAEDPGRPLHGLPEPPRPVAHANRFVFRALFRRILDRPARDAFAKAGLPAPRDVLFLAEQKARLSLALWSRLLRGPVADDPPGMHVCGFAFPVEPDPLAPELDAFLRDGDAPVVVTLGTSARETGAVLYRAAAEACARIGRRAVLLTGKASRPDALPDGIVAFDAAPHGRLLPRACAVVHHAGAGTGAQVLRSGRPAVIVPFGHDQIDNAHRARALGGARIVRRKRASARRLARALHEALDDAGVRESARRYGEVVRREDGAAEAARLVETLARRAGR